MKRFLPLIIAVLLGVAGFGAFYSIVPTAASDESAITTKQLGTMLKAVFQRTGEIDIKLLQRIETIEKKLKITPPKDSLRLEKKK